ncbi:MAG: ImmA/IrrE family metallo-endopeptidase [Comamonas sp.]|jgi:predicted transcriptional regulator|uniref:ImmA/IrrE family metallo-endopeptidase n=1 Tax=Comamonas sp. TaxID=34028 RepID=UPI00283379EB|nr:ImmA/IrrE family metallo-endopeptidase [Comamonas sp.]MDR0216746.1 ImmA/IrrE family metallo-endopeptidase [Comamonas sp.]
MQLHEGFPVAPRKRVHIRAAAQNAREVLSLPAGKLKWLPLLDLLSAKYGIHYDIFDKLTAPVPMEVEACFVPADMTIYIRDSVFDQLAIGGQRAGFTMGHELGHALLAHQRTLNRLTKDVPTYCNSEWQADTFSAELIMPLQDIRQHGLCSVEAIANFFGVSNAAANRRLSELRRHGEL